MYPSFVTPTVVRQHWHVLVFPLLGHAMLVVSGCVCAVALGEAWIALGVALCCSCAAMLRIRAWSLLTITFTTLGVVVQESHFGVPQITTYPYAAVRSTTCVQGPIGWFYNSGTLTLVLATETRRFTGLTPYSLLAIVLA